MVGTTATSFRPARGMKSYPIIVLAAATGFLVARSSFPAAFVGSTPAVSLEAEVGTARSSTGSRVARKSSQVTYTTAPVATPPEDIMTAKQRAFTPSAEHLEYAVAEYSGQQHMITEGSMYETGFIRALPGSKVRLNRVLLFKRKDAAGEFEVIIGQPIIPGAYVEITILEHLKGNEMTVYKHKPKKHYQRRYMVHAKLTRFRVDKIVFDSPDTPVVGRSAYPLNIERSM